MKKTLSLLFIFIILLSSFSLFANEQINNFLIRYVQITTPGGVVKANNYRLRNYTFIRYTKFMDKSVPMNQKVIQSLKCVEKRIKNECNDDYEINHLSGWRDSDTIKGHEISDHIYGIALDVNPAGPTATSGNPCCGCTAKWQKSPLCSGDGVVEHDHGPKTGRYDLPQCWINAFKKENWFWYGDDKSLRDTMHFTFIGKPNQSCQ